MLGERKAAGPDSAPPDALKADPNLLVDIPCGLFGKIWEEEMPQDWNKGYILELPKKGDHWECMYYRGIPSMSKVGKVLNRIILLCLVSVDAALRSAGWLQE